jgi:hypothetical protein
MQMEVTLWHKFTQHSDLKDQLLATGDAELIEVCGGVIVVLYVNPDDVPRIPVKTTSGEWAPIGEAATSLERHLKS